MHASAGGSVSPPCRRAGEGALWIRLRVGFCKDILEALKVSEEVKALLNTSETPMPIKIEKKEWERFAVY